MEVFELKPGSRWIGDNVRDEPRAVDSASHF